VYCDIDALANAGIGGPPSPRITARRDADASMRHRRKRRFSRTDQNLETNRRNKDNEDFLRYW
jgi:hypothetical protein